MHQPGPVIMEGAMDLFTFVVIAVIIINLLAPLFKAIARALSGGASSSADREARQRLSQTLQQSAASSDARRAQELDRLRRALLASAGVAESDESGATQMSTPAPYLTVQTATPSTQSPGRSVAPTSSTPTAPNIATVPRAPSARRQRRITVTTVAPQATPAVAAAVAPVMGDMLQTPGSLLTLESAATAFQTTVDTGAPRVSAGIAPLGVLQGPRAGMNLFVAAAIIGPCAASRPLGHMPGGW